jgi:hypothetical protein
LIFEAKLVKPQKSLLLLLLLLLSAAHVTMPASPDPKDCANPICSSKSDMFRKMTGSSQPKRAASTSKQRECPLDRDELGQNTWSMVSGLLNA